MEPGDLRESPAGSGDPDVGELREETPGGDAEVKCVETNDKDTSGDAVKTVHKDTCEGEECAEKQKPEGEGLHSPYEEELDPRIQVRQNSTKPRGIFWVLLLWNSE